MFKTRLISGIALVAILLATVNLGGGILFLFLWGISLIGMWELFRIVNIHNTFLGCTGMAFGTFYYCLIFFAYEKYALMLFSIYLMTIMVIYVLSFPKYKSEQVTMAFFSLFYVAVMLSCIYRLRVIEQGNLYVWLIFLSSWGSDTCAYCAGMLWGKHKMAPELSPKKSIEGGVGGVTGAALLGGIYGTVASNVAGFDVNVTQMMLVCGVGSVLSQVGDLAASAIKRNYDIKDYGHLIPGHGGVLDRFDSVIFTAPTIYYFICVLHGYI